MCGIFAYNGTKNAGPLAIEGLKRLEYRGYDSWGIVVCHESELVLKKRVGKISDFSDSAQLPTSRVAMAHTRWATTGAVNQTNAHPHFSTDKSFALAQNGIVENFVDLKKSLRKDGFRFDSETDTEVIVRLIEKFQQGGRNFEEAFKKAFKELDGRNTIIALNNKEEIYAARNGSPLVLGINSHTGELFLSSDTLSFAPYADKMIVIDNNQMVIIKPGQKILLLDLKNNKQQNLKPEKITIKASKIDREGYDHFMLKEIFETPMVIREIQNQDQLAYQELATAIKQARQIYVIGSGTAGFAATQIAFYLRIFAGVNAISLVGADARSYYNIFDKNDLIIAPSQSGETADVIEVLEFAKQKGLSVASIVNMPGSFISRLSDFPFMCNAGPEICVMSTKVFCSQIAWGYLLAKTVQNKFSQGKKNLAVVAKSITEYLSNRKNTELIKKLAAKLANKEHIFLLSKYQNFAIINEGMIKLIEGTYKHAHAIPAGDLKHYAITLMEKGIPVIVVVSNDLAQTDLLASINEVKLRGAEIIAIAPQNNESYNYYLPTSDTGETDAIGNIVPLQLLAYYMAVKLGNNVDKPRNIAKSVTVK
jgi:glucosamine--fructose-6-phosphate aminotransferase (isomerizing)